MSDTHHTATASIAASAYDALDQALLHAINTTPLVLRPSLPRQYDRLRPLDLFFDAASYLERFRQLPNLEFLAAAWIRLLVVQAVANPRLLSDPQVVATLAISLRLTQTSQLTSGVVS